MSLSTTAAVTTASGRLHSLDALRATMMLLGLVLHSAASYTLTPLGPAWPYQDRQTNTLFDLLIFFIHLFRMPLFFVTAGFFAALLYVRDGPRTFVVNRSRRVLLPLLVFWPVVIPLGALGMLYAIWRSGAPAPAMDLILQMPVIQQPVFGHLWFLYDLLIFYAAALVAVPVLQRCLRGDVRRRIHGGFRRLTTRSWGTAILAAITALTLLPMEVPALETSAALLPPLRVLVAYAVFFAFGWLLFGNAAVLTSLRDGWALRLAAGLATASAYLYVVLTRPIADPRLWHLSAVALAALATWLVILGSLGLFVRLLDRERPAVRYCSDASYWMYLVHLVPIVWMAGVLAPLTLPASMKFALVLSITTIAVTLTYHYLVRATAIGALLNGRRYPRALPHAAGMLPAARGIPPYNPSE